MHHGWRLLALWILILAAYSNSFQAGLVYDNQSILMQDSRLEAATAANVGRIFTEPYWPNRLKTGLYRPLTTLTYLFNYAILGGGQQPEGYHWVNLALHEVNAGLVYALGLVIFQAAIPAWVMAALWGLHPLATESVTNVIGRADLLAALGVLTGLLCYARGQAAAGARRPVWIAAVAVAQFVGVFSKENAVVLPGLMLLFDWAGPKPARWRARLPFYAALLLPLAAFFWLRGGLSVPMAVGTGENPLGGTNFWSARLTAVKVIGKWLWLFVWPAQLSADYSYNAVPLASWTDVGAVAALVLCLLAAAMVLRWGQMRRPLAFFLAFFFIALAPTSNLLVLIGSIMAERFTYLPAVGLAGCVAAAIYVYAGRREAWAVAGAAALALAARTYARNFDWHDELSLWQSAVAAEPASFKTHANLANALAGVPGRLPEAVSEYQAALRIEPDFGEGHQNLANALAQLGRLPEAVTEYQAAVRLKPDSPEMHYGLGMALQRVGGRMPAATAEFEAALRLKPDFAEAHGGLGNTLAETPGQEPQAMAQYREALRLKPGLAEAHFNLALLLSRTPGHETEAIAEYRAALQNGADSPDLHFDLGNALAGMRERLPEAIGEYRAALRMRPDFWEAHYNLGRALLDSGRIPEAIPEFEAVLAARPDPRIRQLIERLRARN